MSKETLLLFTGDSITDGNRYKKKSQEWDLNHQIGHSYVYILNGLLGSLYPEKHLKFKNKGISGNRIIDLYGRIEPDLLAIEPDILTILVGVNDGPSDLNNYHPTAQNKYEVLYRMLLDEVREKLPACKLVLMEPIIMDTGVIHDEGHFAEWKDCVYGYGTVVKKLAEEFGACFVPLQEEFNRQAAVWGASTWSWDGVHPTENGHGLIARQWIRHAGHLIGVENLQIS